MTRPRRIELTIDRIVTDDPGLSREAVARALEAEIRARLGQGFGPSGAREAARGEIGPGRPSAAGVAKAAMKAIVR